MTSTVRHLLADVNVWLATVVAEHPHHPSAIRWWKEGLLPSGDRLAFCRLTQLGLLRLLTNRRVMGPQRKSIQEAWSIYRQLRAARPVVFAPEPEGTETLLARQCALGEPSTSFWTDSYLAAFARAGELGLVTFDRDFESFPDLELTLLDGR